MHARPGLAVPVLVALSLLAGPRCSDDESNPGIACLAFTATSVPGPGTVVAVPDGANSSCDVAVIDLIVTDVTDLFGASFVVNFDATDVTLGGVTITGSVLSSDGAGVDVIRNTIGSGQVSVGITREATTGVAVVGGQLLATLTFFRFATTNASSPMTFSSAVLLDPGTPPQPIPGITFSGGGFAITT